MNNKIKSKNGLSMYKTLEIVMKKYVKSKPVKQIFLVKLNMFQEKEQNIQAEEL